jgi:hypothetical protein
MVDRLLDRSNARGVAAGGVHQSQPKPLVHGQATDGGLHLQGEEPTASLAGTAEP